MRKTTPLVDRYWAKVEKHGASECWGWRGATANYGYGAIGDAGGRVVRAHRLSWEIHNGPIPDGMKVCHRCDNPPCTNPEHLFLGTQAENLRDCAAKDRRVNPPHRPGALNGAARLTNEQALAIRAAGGTYRAIAKEFGVCKSTVTRIKTGRGWNIPYQQEE